MLSRLSRTASRNRSSLDAINRERLGMGPRTDESIDSHGRQFPVSSHPALSIGIVVRKSGIAIGASLKKVARPVNWKLAMRTLTRSGRQPALQLPSHVKGVTAPVVGSCAKYSTVIPAA